MEAIWDFTSAFTSSISTIVIKSDFPFFVFSSSVKLSISCRSLESNPSLKSNRTIQQPTKIQYWIKHFAYLPGKFCNSLSRSVIDENSGFTITSEICQKLSMMFNLQFHTQKNSQQNLRIKEINKATILESSIVCCKELNTLKTAISKAIKPTYLKLQLFFLSPEPVYESVVSRKLFLLLVFQSAMYFSVGCFSAGPHFIENSMKCITYLFQQDLVLSLILLLFQYLAVFKFS